MLNIADYASLVNEGVQPSMVALVESCYSLLFEATAPAGVATRPIPWARLAEMLDVDTSDCVVDGELKPKLISKKMNNVPGFTEIMDFATRIVENAIAKSGLRDYPDFLKSPTFMNYKYNLRTTVLENTVKMVSERGKSFMSVENMVNLVSGKLAAALDYRLVPFLTRENQFSSTGEDINAAVNRDMRGLPENGENVIYSTREGCVARYDSDTSMVELFNGLEKLAKFSVSKENYSSILAIYNTSPNWALSFSAIGEYLADGPVDGLGNIGDLNIISEEDAEHLWVYADISDIIAIMRKHSDIFERIKNRLWAIGGLRNQVEPLEFLVSSYDRGDIDADSLNDLVSLIEYIDRNDVPSGDYGDVLAETVGPEMMICGIKFFGSAASFADAIYNSDIVDRYTVDCITGKEDSGKVSGVHRGGLDAGLNRPEKQLRIYRKSGISVLIHEIYASNSERSLFGLTRYIPIADEIMKEVFLSSDREPSEMNEVLKYLVNTIERVSPRFRGTLFDDIRKWITPRVVKEMWTEFGHDSGFLDNIEHLRKCVPGFNSSERYRADAGHYMAQGITIDDITPRQFIRELIKSKNTANNNPNGPIELALMAVSPKVLAEVSGKQDTTVGRRIKELVNNIIIKDSSAIVHLHKGIVKVNKDYLGDVAKFLDMFVYPSIEDIRNTVAQYAVLWKQYAAHSPVGDMLLAPMRLLDHGYNELVSKIYLDSDGIFGMNTIDSECLVVKILSDIPGSSLEDVCENSIPWSRFTASLVAGRNILERLLTENIDDKLAAIDDIYPKLLDVDSYYRDHAMAAESVGEVVSDAELAHLFAQYPIVALRNIRHLSTESRNVSALCDKYFTQEFLDTLVDTVSGTELLIELSDLAGWNKFSAQFIAANRVRIENVLTTLPRERADAIRKKLFANTEGVTRHTGKVNEGALGNISYSTANGLWWMTGYASSAASTASPMGVALFSRDEAQNYVDSIRDSGWRLPTMGELKNLGTAANIQRLGIGFSPTGKTGEKSGLFKTQCCGWYGDNDGNVAGRYVVKRNEIKFLSDNDRFVRPEDSLAIKLVHSAH